MLIKHSLKPTNYCLPISYSKNGNFYKINWFYDDEITLFKAYYQLKHLNICYKPLYPIIYDDIEEMNLWDL